jgi:branched-chain amino acid transport system permease protein
MEYFLHIAIFTGVFAILAISLDLVAGHIGCLSLSHAAFYGLGAYGSVLAASHLGISFLACTLAGMLIAVLASLIVSFPSLRLHGDYLVIATFAFQVILFSVLNNWMEITRGPLGIPGIPEPVILGWHITSHGDFLILAGGFAAFAYLAVYLLTSAPFGRVLHAIREDELFAKAHGKNILYFKVTAFATSAALAALAGSLYAHYITYIDPTSFTIMESILIISMVIIGGAGSVSGPLVGALVLVTLPEALRFVGLPSATAANLRQIIYGTLLVVMMMFRPRGLIGKYSFAK